MKHAHLLMNVGLLFPFIRLRDITLRWGFDDAWVAPDVRIGVGSYNGVWSD